MEDKTQKIAAIKEKIGNADIEAAIQELLSFLEKNPAYLEMHSDALQALSQYRNTKKQEAQGLITTEQARLSYNQVTNQVLNLLEELQREEAAGRPRRRLRPLLAGGLVVLLIAAGGAFWYFQREEPVDFCPDFDRQALFQIMLLPFYQPGAGKLDFETPDLLRVDFANFDAEYNLGLSPEPVGFEENQRRQFTRKFHFPIANKEAERAGRNCEAKLVIWGYSDRGAAGRGEKFTTNYKFIFPQQADSIGWRVQKLELAEGSQVTDISFRSNIATEGKLTGNLKEILRYLAGILSHEAGNLASAIAQLENLEVEGDSTGLVRDMMLADSYLGTGDTAKAESAYHRILDQHDNYWLGFHNLGMINLRKGNYQEAIANFDRRLALDSNKVDSRVGRAEAYLKLGKLPQARRDLEAAKQLQPENTTIDRNLIDVRQKIDLQEGILRDSRDRLQNNPNDRQALQDQLQANLKLGNTAEAKRISEILLRQQPDQESFQQVIQSFNEAGQFDAAKDVLQKASSQGLITNQQARKLNQKMIRQ